MFYGDVFKVLNSARVKYVVAGGMAVALHGYVRYTKDVDLIVHLEEKNLSKFFDAIYKIGYRPRVPVSKDQFLDAKARQKWKREKGMVVFSFYHKKDPFKAIDMFVDEPMDFEKLYRERVRVKLEGISVPIISLDHLRALKSKSGRLQDLNDMVQLDAIRKIHRKRKKG